MPDTTQTKPAPASGSPASPKVLVVDVGGTNVKMRMKGQKEATKIPSGPTMTSEKSSRDRQDDTPKAGTTTAFRSAIPDRSSTAVRCASRTISVAAGSVSTSTKPSASR